VYSKNLIFPKNQVFLKILCQKIYETLLTGSPLILYNTVSFSAVDGVQKTALLNFCTPPDQLQFNGESVLMDMKPEDLLLIAL